MPGFTLWNLLVSLGDPSLYRIGFSSNISHYKQQCCKFWFYWPRWKKLQVLNKVELALIVTSILNGRGTISKKRGQKRSFSFSGAGENQRVEGTAPNFEAVKIIAESHRSPRLFAFPRKWDRSSSSAAIRIVEKGASQRGKITAGTDNWFYKFRFGGSVFHLFVNRPPSKNENRSRNRETLHGLEELYRFWKRKDIWRIIFARRFYLWFEETRRKSIQVWLIVTVTESRGKSD